MPDYGAPNLAYIAGWRALEDDGPMWALNLMRYRPLARYADGRETTLTGLEADDLYAPHAALAAVGGRGVLMARVQHQMVGDGARWDRVAVAYYPTRCAQLDMQKLEAFRAQHVHKDAGMEFTIVAASFPDPATVATAPPPADQDRLLLQLVGDPAAPDLTAELESTRLGWFAIEDIILGDERRYAQARWSAISQATAARLTQDPRQPDASSYVLVLAPERDQLLASLLDVASLIDTPAS